MQKKSLKQNKDSQRSKIKSFLESGKKLTRLAALNKGYGIELPTRIWELQNWYGMDIKREFITTKNGARVARYYL